MRRSKAGLKSAMHSSSLVAAGLIRLRDKEFTVFCSCFIHLLFSIFCVANMVRNTEFLC